MAQLNGYEMDMVKAMRHVEMQVIIKRGTELKWRIWLGAWLIALAAWIMNCNVKITEYDAT